MQGKSNPILDYWHQIENGLTVSKKIRITYRKLVKDLKSNDEFEYDERRADHAIFFIEKFCKHSKGKMAGKPFILELWQKAAVAAMFGFVNKKTKLRKYKEVVLFVGRKNGKSTLAAAVGLYLMVADGEGGPEIYAVATKKDQAKIIWKEAKRMVAKSPILRKKVKSLVAELNTSFNDGIFMALGRDSDGLDGLNVHGGLFDEIHAWKDKNLYDVVRDGTSARDQSLIFVTSTMGTVRQGIFDIKYEEAERIIHGYESDEVIDEEVLYLIYELDERSEWTNQEAWKKANPGLCTIKKVTDLNRKVRAAQENSLLVKNLLCKDFNVRETGVSAFMTFEEIQNTTKVDYSKLNINYGYTGTDLSKTTDLTASVILFKTEIDGPIYIEPMFWLPEDLIEQRSKEDKIPYDIWKKQGYLRTTPGNQVHPKFITQWHLEMEEKLNIRFLKIGYDAWSAKYWVEEMEGYFGKTTTQQVFQGKRTLSGPMHSIKAELAAKHIIYNDNPILKWCMSNVEVDIDKNGNIQPTKGRDKKRRIDGFAAMLNAYVVYLDDKETYETYI